jgi:hypothetical protein
MPVDGLRPGPIDREDAVRVLGEPVRSFAVSQAEVVARPNHAMLIEIPALTRTPAAEGARHVAYEWACGDDDLPYVCTAVESAGVLVLVLVCPIHYR